MDSWKTMQTKTFAKWINAKLNTQIESLFEDLHDGLVLAKLLTHLTGHTFEKMSDPAVTRYQKVENVNYVLNFISSNNFKLVNIGSVDIVDKNEKLMLGLVWIVILRFSILRNVSDSELLVDNTLLAWCKSVVANYDIPIKDFSRSWQDGRGFNAVIHRFCPEYVDMEKVANSTPFENLQHAFDIANTKLNIPPLLDAEDICGVLKPDEKSVMTYLSLFFDKFKNQIPKSVSNTLDVLRKTLQLRKDAFDNLHIQEQHINQLEALVNKNNAEYAALMSEILKLKDNNDILCKDIKNKKLEVAATIGTIKTIENTLKIRNAEESDENLELSTRKVKINVRNALDQCSMCNKSLESPSPKIYDISAIEESEIGVTSDKPALESTTSLSNSLKSHYADPHDIQSLLDDGPIEDQLTKNPHNNDNMFNRLFTHKTKILNHIKSQKSAELVKNEATLMFKAIDNTCTKIKASEADIIYNLLNLNKQNDNVGSVEIVTNENTKTGTEYITYDSFISELEMRHKQSFDICALKNRLESIRDFKDSVNSANTVDEEAYRKMREAQLVELETLFSTFNL